MTIEKCITLFIAKVQCMKRKTSGTNRFCNSNCCDDCYLQYEQGNIGEQKEALAFALTIIRKYCQIVRTYKLWNKVNDFSYDTAMLRIADIIADDEPLTSEKYKSLINAIYGIKAASGLESEGDNDNQG